MKKFAFLIVLSIMTSTICASCQKLPPIIKTQIISNPEIKVVGYINAWPCDINKIQFEKLTHINYAFALPTSVGGLAPIENPINLQNLIIEAHAKKVKVILSIGGANGGADEAFESLTKNQAYLTNFVKTITDLISQYNLDGVDIDWESPIVGKTDVSFSSLIQQLSKVLHQNKKLLTIAVPFSNGEFVSDDLVKAVDFINIMAYDNVNEKNHSSYNLADSALDYWLARGVPREKAILGIPFYGRTLLNWQFLSYDLYHQILEKGGSADSDIFNKIQYNGITTVKSKTLLALKKGGGVMIWELGGDTDDKTSLLSAINEVVTYSK